MLDKQYQQEENSQSKVKERKVEGTENTKEEFKHVEEKQADTATEELVYETEEMMKVNNAIIYHNDPHTCILTHKSHSFTFLLYHSISQISVFCLFCFVCLFVFSESEHGVTGSRV